MPLSEPFTLEKLNLFFEKNILNQQLLSRYYNLHGKTLSDDISLIINSTFKQRASNLASAAKKIAEITGCSEQRCREIFSSKKKTDITQFWTSILIPKDKDRKMVQTARTKLIVRLRKGECVGRAEFQAFKTLYELVSRLDFKVNFDQQNCQTQKQFKSMLISLKKLMGVEKAEKQISSKVKKAKRQAYLSNIDIKNILSECCFSVTEQGLRTKVQGLLKDSKNKSWFGPNLYKAFQNSGLSVEQMLTMARLMENISLEHIQFKTNQSFAQRNLKKIITNLKFYLKDKVNFHLKIEEISDSIQEMEDEERGQFEEYENDSQDDQMELPSVVNFSPETFLGEEIQDFAAKVQYFQIDEVDQIKQEFTLFHTLCFNPN